jgi:hypothetical protein
MTIIAHVDEHACAAHGDCVDVARPRSHSKTPPW